MTEQLVTLREAARRLGVHENTIRNWGGKGVIQLRQLPTGIHRVPAAEVQRLERSIFAAPLSFPPDDTYEAPKSVHDTAQERPRSQITF